jgi:hypothetical protein
VPALRVAETHFTDKDCLNVYKDDVFVGFIKGRLQGYQFIPVQKGVEINLTSLVQKIHKFRKGLPPLT